MIDLPKLTPIISPRMPEFKPSEVNSQSAAGDITTFSKPGDRWVGDFAFQKCPRASRALDELREFYRRISSQGQSFKMPVLGQSPLAVDLTSATAVLGSDRLRVYGTEDDGGGLIGRMITIDNRVYVIEDQISPQIFQLDHAVTQLASVDVPLAGFVSPHHEAQQMSLGYPALIASEGVYGGGTVEWQSIR